MINAIDFRRIPAAERLAHYGLLFAMAAADGSFEHDEMFLIHDVLDAEGLNSEERERLRSFAVTPPTPASCLEILQSSRDELRHGTLMSLVDIAYSDGVVTGKEEAALEAARVRLKVRPGQLRAMMDFVDELGDIDLAGEPTEGEIQALARRAGAMTQAGVPLAAAAFSATVGRILRFGPESLRSALGLGLGQIPGTPMAVLVGTQIAVSVSELLHGSETGSDEVRARRLIRRERLQEAIEHLQASIEEIGGEIVTLKHGGATEQDLAALEGRRAGLVQLARTRRSALEDL